jgi:hypothetical protein
MRFAVGSLTLCEKIELNICLNKIKVLNDQRFSDEKVRPLTSYRERFLN